MPLSNLLWAIIILLRYHNVICFNPTARNPVGGMGAPVSDVVPGSITFQPQDSEENKGRPVYDPGDELLRALNSDEPNDYVDNVINDLQVNEKYDLFRKLEDDIREEQDIVSKSALLMKLLEDPSVDTLPLVYVEEANPPAESNEVFPAVFGLEKRSRYYRRYPWKRHSRNRGSYEPEIRYACTPSKEDVFKLLIGLHENRNGNHHRTVSFCNRKRPAKAIFTNIRFLG